MKAFIELNLLRTKFILLLLLFTALQGKSQSFAPQVGLKGSTAIYKDSSVFIDWAVSCQIHRGYIDISNSTETDTVSFGIAKNALGAPGGTMDVVSLGDGGYAILSFHYPIVDGPGPDFAVFENGFLKNNNPYNAFVELAFVEVSEDGENYYRFPAISELPTDKQIGTFDGIDARYIHNLAGKYIANYGTPFDLTELKKIYPNLNINNINYVKIVDVIGAINSPFTTYDYYGNPINDPYPTPFASGGFDLDAVGVIHNSLTTQKNNFVIFPNPVQKFLTIIPLKKQKFNLQIITLDGRIIYQIQSNRSIKLPINQNFKPCFIIRITTDKICIIKKIIAI